MRSSILKPLMIAVAVTGVVGFGAFAFAHMGGGWGGYGMMHHGWLGESGDGYAGDLSDEDYRALEKERRDFFEATEKIRQDLYTKQLELQNELAKPNPDADRASELQQEISSLNAKLDQKRIDHMVKLRKINPEAGRGYAGMGPMTGYQGGYGGACW